VTQEVPGAQGEFEIDLRRRWQDDHRRLEDIGR
jgi:hypothetical protein